MDLAAEEGTLTWLTVIPLKEISFNLNKRDFRNALRLRYNWPFSNISSKCVCSEEYSVEHAMICKRRGFIIQRHDQLRNLKAKLLSSVGSDVEIKPLLHEISNERLGTAWQRSK